MSTDEQELTEWFNLQLCTVYTCVVTEFSVMRRSGWYMTNEMATLICISDVWSCTFKIAKKFVQQIFYDWHFGSRDTDLSQKQLTHAEKNKVKNMSCNTDFTKKHPCHVDLYKHRKVIVAVWIFYITMIRLSSFDACVVASELTIFVVIIMYISRRCDCSITVAIYLRLPFNNHRQLAAWRLQQWKKTERRKRR